MIWYSSFQDSSKVFIFQADRFFTAEEVLQIQEKLNAFTPSWNAHGKPITSHAMVTHQVFLVFVADETKGAPLSGCSKDSLTHVVQEIATQYKIDFFNRWNVVYLNDMQEIVLDTKESFDQKLQSGEVHSETKVFNNLIQTKKDLEEKWCIPFNKSWHKRVYGVSQFTL